MPRARKPWSKLVEVHGVAVRLYERGGAIYREVRLGGGAKDRQSRHTGDRAHAMSVLWLLGPLFPDSAHAAAKTPPVWETAILFPILVGLISGVVGSGLWEGTVKRYRDRRDLARALAAEVDSVSRHAATLELCLEQRPEPVMPLDYRFTTSVFDALAPRIIELRPDELSAVLFVYNQTRLLNAVGEAVWATTGNEPRSVISFVMPGSVERWRVLRADPVVQREALVRARLLRGHGQAVGAALRRRYSRLPVWWLTGGRPPMPLFGAAASEGNPGPSDSVTPASLPAPPTPPAAG